MRSVERAESVIRLNAFCVLCDAIANGTLTDLTNAGWTPTGCDGWYCREHRPRTAAELEPDATPWWATWGPHTLEAMCALMSAACADRSHWTLTGPDVVVVKGEVVRYDDDQMRMAA